MRIHKTVTEFETKTFARQSRGNERLSRKQLCVSVFGEKNELQTLIYATYLWKLTVNPVDGVEFTAEKNHLFHFLTYRWRYCCAPRKTLQKCL